MKKSPNQNRSKVFIYGLFLMSFTHALTHIFLRLYTASFPLLREEFSLSIQQLGLLAAIPPIFQTILYIPSGLLTDRLGSKTMLLVSLAVGVVGSVLVAMVPNPVILILAASLVYLSTTLYHPASYSLTTRIFSDADRPKALGIHGAGGTLGMALGPLTLSLFIGLLGLKWRHVWIFWVFPILFSIILVMRVSQEDYQREETVSVIEEPKVTDTRKFLSNSLIFFLVFQAFRTVAIHMVSTFMPIYIVDEKGLTVSQMGLIYGSLSLTGLVSAPLGGIIASRVGNKRWLTASILMSMIALGLVPLVPNILTFIITYLTYGFTNTLGMASRSSLVADLTPRDRRGLGYALLFLPGSMMSSVAPIFAAYLIEGIGITSLFPISILFTLAGLIVMLLGVKITQN
jgi:MFS family permease